jgi:hypothetical protein
VTSVENFGSLYHRSPKLGSGTSANELIVVELFYLCTSTRGPPSRRDIRSETPTLAHLRGNKCVLKLCLYVFQDETEDWLD